MTVPLLSRAEEAFQADPSKPAVIEDHAAWSWLEFSDQVRRTAGLLETTKDQGPVGILLPSGASFLRVFLAAATVERPACTLHPDWAAPELEAAIEDARLSLVFTDRSDLPGEAKIIDSTIPECDGGGSASAVPRVDPDPLFYIGFTSGTSGRPKPFARRQGSWASSFDPAGELFSINSGDQVFLPGSMQHSHFLFGAILGLNRGASVRLFERFDPDLLAAELRATTRGVLYLVPTMLLDLDRSETKPFEGVHSVLVSGAKMEPHHWEIMRRLFPEALVGEFYGASELSFVTVNVSGESKSDPGYVGRPFPGVELDIRPTEDSSPDQPGVVYVRSPYLFDGYLNRPANESPIGDDGFMTVGDMGVLGPDGLSLAGRNSNLLITGGKNVHPEEIEAQLSDHPAVTEGVVVGVPHPRWGEEIVAFITVAGDRTPAADELKDHLRDRIAGYKIPKRWFVLSQVPRTRAGKTDRSRDRLFEDATKL